MKYAYFLEVCHYIHKAQGNPVFITSTKYLIDLQRWLTLYSKFRFLIHQLQCMDHLEIWKEIKKKCLEFLKNHDKNYSRITIRILQESQRNCIPRRGHTLGLIEYMIERVHILVFFVIWTIWIWHFLESASIQRGAHPSLFINPKVFRGCPPLTFHQPTGV